MRADRMQKSPKTRGEPGRKPRAGILSAK